MSTYNWANRSPKAFRLMRRVSEDPSKDCWWIEWLEDRWWPFKSRWVAEEEDYPDGAWGDFSWRRVFYFSEEQATERLNYLVKLHTREQSVDIEVQRKRVNA